MKKNALNFNSIVNNIYDIEIDPVLLDLGN